jgi:hypothetical protein
MTKVRNVLVCLLAMVGTWLVLQAVRPQEPPPVSPCGDPTGPPPLPCEDLNRKCKTYDNCETGNRVETLLRGYCCEMGAFGRCWQYYYYEDCCLQEGRYLWKARCEKSQEPTLAQCDSQTRRCE